MGIAERKEREKLQRKQEIITAAEKIFFSKGFINATMDDIASQAELSKGTIYLYFKNKEELFNVFVHQAISKLYDLFVEYSSKQNSGILKVKAIGEAYIKFYFDYPNYYQAIMYDESQVTHEFTLSNLDDEVTTIKMATNQFFIDTIQEGINDGSINKNLDPLKTSLILWGETLGVLQLVTLKSALLEKKMNLSSEKLISYFFELTYNMLKA
jgi:AcrR family transcriptional regulator